MVRRIGAANSCADLKGMNDSIAATVNTTIQAVQGQISEITNQVNNMAAQLDKIGAHVGTLSATQGAATSVASVGATASGVSDLSSAIAYCKAQGAALSAYGNAHTASLVQEALDLKSNIAAITEIYNLAVKQVANLNAQVTSLTTGLANVQSAIASAATRFPNCSI